MLKIPKQIYFDEPTLMLYSQYARQQNISFAAAVRNTLAAHPPKLSQVKKTSILNFYGAGKSPYKRKFSAREEREIAAKIIGENAAREGLYD
ncbi:MAG: hypothetical protein M1484_02490 [Patescibacteria group bacterium]|nr:hypothetical protein [Patescibacteria group bacterium]MCL5431949.1 hypothetical protein [Patescibacteria group bacterium]